MTSGALAGRVILALLLAAGCTEPKRLFGTYQLRTISGASLPVVVYTYTGHTAAITAGYLVLQPDSSFSLLQFHHDVTNGVTNDYSTTDKGRFWFSGGNLNLADTTAGSGSGLVPGYVATWDGNKTITYVNSYFGPGFIATYLYSK